MNDESPTFEFGDLADQLLGEFKLVRRLGRGGMAEVYLAEQTSLSRFVAVKVLLPEMLKDADGTPLKRFEQEARTAGSINHPNIVQVHTIGEQNGLHYIVQEFVEGMNLSEYVKRNGTPDAKTGLHIMRQVAAALKVAGEAGIVHRDIKPENIMLTVDDIAKVADFGLAQLNQPKEALNLTQRGTTMGTPLYMSVEQINGEKLDQRSDLYSFGVTCYYMFAGRPPFRGETAMAVAAQHLKESPDALRDRRPDLPKAVCGLIERMMNKKPDDRFQDASELIAAIDKASEAVAHGHDDLSLSALGVPSIPSKQAARRSGRRLALMFVATCVGVGLASAAIGAYLRPVDPMTVQAKAGDKSLGSKEKQFAAAIANPTKATWRAVIRHYGGEPLEGGWARIHLGRILIDERRLKDAAEYFAYVKSNPEKPLQAQAQIGLAAIEFERGNEEEAFRMIEDIDRDGIRGTVMGKFYASIDGAQRQRDSEANRRGQSPEGRRRQGDQ